MKSVLVIAINTFKAGVRRRYLHILTILTLLILAGVSLVSFFDLGVQIKFLKDLSLGTVGLFGMAITIVLVTNQIPSEVEDKTIYPLLAKPLWRWEFLLGKYLGCLVMIFFNLAIVGIELLLIIWWKGGGFETGLLKAISLIWMEMVLFSSMVLFLSLILSPPACATMSLFIYFLGHLKANYLHYLIGRAESDFTRWVFEIFYYLLPNLENFNIRDAVITGIRVSGGYLFKAGFYSASFSLLFLGIACLLFRRKEL